MVEVLNVDGDDLLLDNAKAIRQTTIVPRVVTPAGVTGDDVSFGEAFIAGAARENLIVNMVNSVSNIAEARRQLGLSDNPLAERGDELGPPDFSVPGFNARQFAVDNLSDEDLKEFDLFLRRGVFDSTTNPTDFLAKMFQLRTELERLRQIDGNFTGSFLGALAGGTVDLTIFAPVGRVIQGTSRLATAGRFAGAAGQAAAIQEVGLHQFQDLRTMTESFMAVGISSVLGAGIGTFARAVADVRHPLHNRNPANHLAEENLGAQSTAVRTPDGREDIIQPPRDGESTVGAAKVEPRDVDTEAVKGMLDYIPGLRNVSRFVRTNSFLGTPFGRATAMKLARGREIMQRMMDMSSVIKKGDVRGRAAAPDAESIKIDLLALRSSTTIRLENLVGKLAKDGITVSDRDFMDLVRKALFEELRDGDLAPFLSKLTPDQASSLADTAKQGARIVHDTNAKFADELRSLGRLQDEQIIASLEARLDALERQIAGDKAQGVKTVDPDEVKAVREQLREERAKPEDLGDEYGHAQIWLTDAILADREGFQNFLLDVFAVEPDARWLDEIMDMTPNQLEKLRTTDPDEYTRIIRTYAGDEQMFAAHKAELEVERAERALRESEEDLTYTAKALGFAKREKRRVELSEARKFRDKAVKDFEAARAARQAAEAEERAFVEAATAARTQTLARKEALADPVDDLKPKAKRAAKKGPEGDIDPKQAGRAGEAAVAARRAKRAEEEAAVRADRAESALREVEQRMANLRDAESVLEDAWRAAKGEAKSAGRDARKALRALRKAKNRPAIWDTVEQVTNQLTGGNFHGRIQAFDLVPAEVAVTTGRIKERVLRLPPDLRRIGTERGYLDDNLGHILYNQYEQLAGWIGLHKALDIRKGGEFSSFSGVVAHLRDEYEIEIAAATSEAERRALRKEAAQADKDLKLLKDRLLGTENRGMDRSGFLYWSTQKALQANYIRYGAGFLVPSFTDLASVFLRTGSLASLLKNHGPEVARLLKTTHAENPSEFLAFVRAVELSAGGTRLAKLADFEDIQRLAGVGEKGSTLNKVTASIDRGATFLQEKTPVISGMRYWNRYWKIIAGVYRMHRVRDMVGNWQGLKEFERADLVGLGIDEVWATQINKMIQKHGKTSKEGDFDPGLEKWVNEGDDGVEAAARFRMAIQKDMNRAVFTPGIGDTPNLMSSQIGRLWLQFQSYSFTFMNRALTPASQRIATFRDAQAIVAFAHLAWMGAVVVAAKDVIRGKDPVARYEDEQWEKTTYDIIDRSGLLMYFTPFLDTAFKLPTGDGESIGSSLGLSAPSRFARNENIDSALGANFRLAKEIFEFSGTLTEGDRERMWNKGKFLLPWNTWLRTSESLAEATGLIDK